MALDDKLTLSDMFACGLALVVKWKDRKVRVRKGRMDRERRAFVLRLGQLANNGPVNRGPQQTGTFSASSFTALLACCGVLFFIIPCGQCCVAVSCSHLDSQNARCTVEAFFFLQNFFQNVRCKSVTLSCATPKMPPMPLTSQDSMAFEHHHLSS